MGFGVAIKVPFFDVGVFTLTHEATATPVSLLHIGITRWWRKREYGHRVWEVELTSFTPLVFSTTGGMGRKGTVFYHQLADLLVNKHGRAYSTTIGFIVSLLFFAEVYDYVYKKQRIHLFQVLFCFSWEGPGHESTWCVKSIMHASRMLNHFLNLQDHRQWLYSVMIMFNYSLI